MWFLRSSWKFHPPTAYSSNERSQKEYVISNCNFEPRYQVANINYVVHGWNNSSSELEAHQRSQKDYVNATAILKQDIRLPVRTISYMAGTMCSCLKLTHQRYVYVITIVPNTQSDVTISPSTNTNLATSSTMILGRAIMILVGQVTIVGTTC